MKEAENNPSFHPDGGGHYQVQAFIGKFKTAMPVTLVLDTESQIRPKSRLKANIPHGYGD